MSLNYLYHSVECDAVNNNGYTEFDTLDFSLDFSNRAMIAGTIRLEGELEVRGTGTAAVLPGARITCDHMIGAHVLVQSCVSQTLNAGVIENITNLPRLAKMKTSATECENDMLNAKYVCELRSPDAKVQEKVIKPRQPQDIGGGGTGVADNTAHIGSGFGLFNNYNAGGGVFEANAQSRELPDFSFKPQIVFNTPISQSNQINYSTTGTIKLSFNLARVSEALYGADMVSGSSYIIRNPRVCFVSVPEPAKQAPVSLRSSVCLKSNINSQLSNTSNRVPSICDSCSISFMELSRENSLFFNNTELETLPNVDALRFMFNDSTNKYITYELKNTPEIVAEGLKALANGTGSHNVRLDKLYANKGYIAGLKFGEAVDLSKQKFNIQVQSGVSNTNPFCMWAYFHSVVSF